MSHDTPSDLQTTDTAHKLLFLHGFLGDRHDWVDLEGALNALDGWNADTLTMDLPGHGSDGPIPSDTWPDVTWMGQRVLEAMDAMGLGQAALCGYSMGGRIALHLAVQHPERISYLVLESASPGLSDATTRQQRQWLDSERAAMLRMQGLGEFLHHWYAMDLFASLRAHPGFGATMARRLEGDAESLARVLEAMSPGGQPALWEQLDAVQCPVLFVAGAEDRTYVDIGARTVGRLGEAQLAVAPGAGHNVHVEAPHWMALQIRDFLLARPKER